MPGELVLAACPVAGVRPSGWALAGAEASVLAALLLEAWALRSLYVAARARGTARRAARRAAVREAVPVTVRRLVHHELRALASLGRWVRRGTHGVRRGDFAAAYTGPRTAMMYGLLFVVVIETVGLAFLTPGRRSTGWCFSTTRSAPVLSFTRPLGATEQAHAIRFHADDPRALVTALRQPA
nr:hypothetical protein [Streptomyces adustus]